MRPLTLLLLGLLVAGCDSGPETVDHTAMGGTWAWVSSTDVETGEVHTPETEGYDARLVFTPDDGVSGSYRYERVGGEPRTVEGRYAVGFENAPGRDFVVIDTPIDFLDETAWLSRGSEVLRLGGVFELGYTTLYARVR